MKFGNKRPMAFGILSTSLTRVVLTVYLSRGASIAPIAAAKAAG